VFYVSANIWEPVFTGQKTQKQYQSTEGTYIHCVPKKHVTTFSTITMIHRLATNYAKNYCNRTPIVEVIVENVVTCFWDTVLYTDKANIQ